MKQKFLIYFLMVLSLSACKKNEDLSTDFLKSMQKDLRDSLNRADYNQLDFQHAIRYLSFRNQNTFINIPFRRNVYKKQFLLIQASASGKIMIGKIIQIEREDKSLSPKNAYDKFNGKISISSMNRKDVLYSNIVDGFIEAFHQRNETAKSSIVPAITELPEVIIVCSYAKDYSFNYSTWLLMESIFYDVANVNNLTSAYTFIEGDGGSIGGTGDGISTLNFGSTEESFLSVDREMQDLNPAINLSQFIKCFNNIPDAGATCSIEIFADVPVDNRPAMLFNYENGSPGHTFIQIKKANGGMSVVQNIGFYPLSGLKAGLTNGPIDGKFVDNGLHEYNASLKMNITSSDLSLVLNEIERLGSVVKYDIDDYNCTNFALDVFNKVRSEKIIIPLYNIPGNYPATGTKTPQGLFALLNNMKEAGHPEAQNITIDIQKGWVSTSTGPCN